MRGSRRHLAGAPIPHAQPPALPEPRHEQQGSGSTRPPATGPPGDPVPMPRGDQGRPHAPVPLPGAAATGGEEPVVVDEGDVTEVIRPAAIVPEGAARAILAELALADVTRDGLWQATTSHWSRWDRPWVDAPDSVGAMRIGTIQVAYGTPTRYEITIYRVTVTRYGQENGWSVEVLTDEALGFGGLTLAECPRAALGGVPRPFRH